MTKINWTVFRFSIHQIANQPLSQFYLFIFALFILFLPFISLTIVDGQVIVLEFFKFVFGEPWIINGFVKSFISLFLIIILFISILIINRFWGEILKDPLLDIISIKIKNDKIIVFSACLGILLFSIIPVIISLIFALLLIYFKYNLCWGIDIFLIIVNFFLVINYLSSFSFLFAQILDEFSSSLILILLFFFGDMITSQLGSTDIGSTFFNIVFPLSNLAKSVSQQVSGEINISYYSFLPILTITILYYLGLMRFKKRIE